MNSKTTSFILALSIALCTPATGMAQSLSDLGKLLGNRGNSTTEKSVTTPDSTATTTTTTSSNPMSGLLNSLGGGSSSNTNTTTTNTTTNSEATTTTTTSSNPLGGLLNSLGGGSSSNSSTSSSSGLGDILGGIISNVITANQDLTVADLQGNWAYAAPSCKFTSEDFLMSAGGEVVASQISDKLTPIYGKLGFTPEKYRLEFDGEGKYTMTFGQLPISGEATKGEAKGYFTFEFIKLGEYALATTPTYIEVLGDKMVLLYEADKFIDLFSSVVSKLGISSLNTIVELVNSYDGVLIGFELNK